jgi:hypothetical protein
VQKFDKVQQFARNRQKDEHSYHSLHPIAHKIRSYIPCPIPGTGDQVCRGAEKSCYFEGGVASEDAEKVVVFAFWEGAQGFRAFSLLL